MYNYTDPVFVTGIALVVFGTLSGLAGCFAFMGRRFTQVVDHIEREGFFQRYVLYDKLVGENETN